MPASAAGARLVTLHGDVHYRNVVRTGTGLQLIDAEMACVGSAIHDIAYCWSDTFNGCVCATSERKDAFIEAYLVESGLPAEPEDVFALRLDAERCRMGTNFTGPKALAVHIEADGVLRLAERPHQAFDCANGATAAGTPVYVYHNHCEDNQRFVANDDATLSPVGNRNVVWGVHGDDLTLVGKDDAWAQRLTFCEEVLAAARVPGAATLVKNEPPVREAEHLLELASHPGMALSAVPADAGGAPWKLMLVPVEQACRIVVAADHLRLVAGGWILAPGEPPTGCRD